jgi:hypothetical protein
MTKETVAADYEIVAKVKEAKRTNVASILKAHRSNQNSFIVGKLVEAIQARNEYESEEGRKTMEKYIAFVDPTIHARRAYNGFKEFGGKDERIGDVLDRLEKKMGEDHDMWTETS